MAKAVNRRRNLFLPAGSVKELGVLYFQDERILVSHANLVQGVTRGAPFINRALH